VAVIALDLGGTKLAGALFAESGRLLVRDSVLLNGRTGPQVGALLCRQTAAFLEIARARRLRVVGVGVSVPGISNHETGTVWAPNIPGWKRYPLRRELKGLLGTDQIRVAIENDRACSVLGESWRGGSRGCRHLVFLAVGTGIAAGVIHDGHVLSGAHGIAGSIGWMALQPPFQDNFIPCGCLEYYASGAGIARHATDLLLQQKRAKQPSPHSTLKAEHLTAQDVFRACDGGDPIAQTVVNTAITFWGMAVANLVSAFNPAKFVFGGGLFGPAGRFLPQIRAEAQKWAQPVAIRQVTLEVSKLGTDTALYGAAFLAAGRDLPHMHEEATKPQRARSGYV